jgi:hypothetical protein
VLFYATTELHQRRYAVIFGVFILFCYWWPYFVICGLCRTIRACGCLFLLFVLRCYDIEWVLRYWSFVDMSEYFGTGPLWTWVKIDDWFDLSSTCTLTHVKKIETCVESVFATVCVQSAIAGCFLLFGWGRLGRVALHQVTWSKKLNNKLKFVISSLSETKSESFMIPFFR